MSKKGQPPSQGVDLFLTVADALGAKTDREVAALAEVVPDNVANWRQGLVREFKANTLDTIKTNLVDRIKALALEVDAVRASTQAGLHPLIVEAGSSPDELHRQFRERVAFDYLGHRFLYYEPQGAHAWLNLIQSGYDQDQWLAGTVNAAREWLSKVKDAAGRAKGPIAQGAQLDRGSAKGIEVIGLGAGDGSKEAAVFREVVAAGEGICDGLTFVPVDVSIPLLLKAAVVGRQAAEGHAVVPLCADFEEGPLTFESRLPSTLRPAQRVTRVITLLGNTFGNLRDEDRFVRHKLWRLARSGDFVWLEVALRIDPISDDPIFKMTEPGYTESAAETNRRLLLEGPFRRWEAASGRAQANLDFKVYLREDDDTSNIPGSCNFCHDLVLAAERRAFTMLFSRRYRLDPLKAWLEERDLVVERVQTVLDGRRRPRIAHLLMRRR